ncbi:MAG: hypothetical protein ACFBSC_13870 [Microcoleaceae cyanobacterium]
MRVHFVAVGENSLRYVNMIKALVYSFRRNAGIYRDAPFTIVFNGAGIPESESLALQHQFDPLHIKVMPRLGGTPYTNKFNAFYAVDESSYDALVFMDCDMVVLDAMDQLVECVRPGELYFSALPTGSASRQGLVCYGRLLEQYCHLSATEVESYRSSDFATDYPMFNSGFIVLTQPALMAIREDAVKISYDLYYRKTPSNSKEYLAFGYYRLLTSSKNPLIKAITPYLLSDSEVSYPLWCCEQIGLTLAVIKHRIPMEILAPKFNWCSTDSMPSGSDPAVLHYMKGLFEIDRDNLFQGDWIQAYLNSDMPMKRALAQVVGSYVMETEVVGSVTQ